MENRATDYTDYTDKKIRARFAVPFFFIPKVLVKLFQKLIFFLFLFVFFISVHGNERLAEAVENCLKGPLYRNVDVGIRIERIDDGEVIYQRNGNKGYIPASAIKVFTSAISLIKFGGDFRFETPLMADGAVFNNILEGNLYLVGRGDPALMPRHLEEAARQLKLSGIDIIEGDIIYDTSFLEVDSPRYPPNARHYYAPCGAVTVHFNWLDLELDEGPPVRLFPVPRTAYARLDYKLKVSQSQRPGRPKMTYREEPWGDLYTIRGTVTQWDRRYDYLKLCVTRPGLFGATLLKEACQRAGIEVKGRIRKGKISPGMRVLYKMETPELIEVIHNLNRESNNVVAELLNKDLGAYFDSVPGTRAKGLGIMRRFIEEKLEFPANSFSIVDASGLSPENRFSALQFTRALNYFHRELGKTFVETLAPQGHHPHAMEPVPPEGMRVFVKSGTLSVTGVNAVVGYIILEGRGDVYSFAILCNRRGGGGLAYSGTFTNPILSAVIKTFSHH